MSELTIEIVNSQGVTRRTLPNGQWHDMADETPLSRIGRDEMDMLLNMLRALTLTKKDVESLTPEYLDTLPKETQTVLQALKTVVADPTKLEEVLQQYGATTSNGNRMARMEKEFSRIATELATTGEAKHEHLQICLDSYGDDEKLAGYKAPGGRLDKRINDSGYTFFILREDGKPVALASGDANHFSTGKLSDEEKKQFRLMNVAVPAEHQGKEYGTQLMETVRHYAEENRYKEIVIPESISALVKNKAASPEAQPAYNPQIYRKIAKNIGVKPQEEGKEVVEYTAHATDPLSILMKMGVERVRQVGPDPLGSVFDGKREQHR